MSKRNFRRELTEAKKQGFVPLELADMYLRVESIDSPSGRTAESKAQSVMNGLSNNIPQAFDERSVVNAVPVKGKGSEGLGYIKYGDNDRLPNDIYRFFSGVPYTATAIEYNTDVKFGMGPRLMYHGSYYRNGALQTVCFPYEQAGEWLVGRIAELRKNMQASDDDDTLFLDKVLNGTQEPEVGSEKWMLNRLTQEYKDWEVTMQMHREFTANNNIEQHFLKCMQDDSYYDLYYPMISLEKGRKGDWNPKIIRIGHKPTISVRKEQMDEKWKVNHIYFSDKWRTGQTPSDDEIVAYPVVDADHFIESLRSIVSAKENKAVGARPLWLSVPQMYSCNARPYYPVPKAYSLIVSRVLEYASTLVYDKNIMRQNSTMWGKMVLINLTYFKAMCDQQGFDENQALEYKKNLQDSINDFLKRRENNGKVLFSDSFLSDDQKQMYDAIKIIDVPQNTNARETKDELEEISSIILFTFGIHPSLIGATPGKTPTTGGTQQRELYLLKQIQMHPRQLIYLNFLNGIIRWNGYDPHAVYEIQKPVLTTLDRNASGIEIQSN